VPAVKIYQSYLDKSTPYTPYRWIGTGILVVLFMLRIIFAEGWYIGTSRLCAVVDEQPLT